MEYDFIELMFYKIILHPGSSMTRLIFIDDELVLLLEVELPAAALVEAVQREEWQPPAQLAALLAGGCAPLHAVKLGRMVILSTGEERETGELPTLEGLIPLALSPRQRQVLQGLADGMSSKEIGQQLGLHRRTVDLHIAAIKRRFGTTNRIYSVMRGAALGLCKVRPNPKGPADIGYTRAIERGPTRSYPPRKNDEERTLPDPPD
jgi:DNA-binding CsgD family transcriptional regulator